jgi:hypothetical protein
VFNATLKSNNIVHSLNNTFWIVKILTNNSFKKSLAIQGVYRINTDNTRLKEEKTLHNKQKIGQHGSHSKQGDWRTKRDEDQRHHSEFVRKVIALCCLDCADILIMSIFLCISQWRVINRPLFTFPISILKLYVYMSYFPLRWSKRSSVMQSSITKTCFSRKLFKILML